MVGRKLISNGRKAADSWPVGIWKKASLPAGIGLEEKGEGLWMVGKGWDFGVSEDVASVTFLRTLGTPCSKRAKLRTPARSRSSLCTEFQREGSRSRGWERARGTWSTEMVRRSNQKVNAPKWVNKDE